MTTIKIHFNYRIILNPIINDINYSCFICIILFKNKTAHYENNSACCLSTYSYNVLLVFK